MMAADRVQCQLAGLALQEYWTMESRLPLEAYPPTGLKTYADEFGGVRPSGSS
jgi:hypothetical protein